MDNTTPDNTIATQTATIVAAFVTKNPVATGDLPGLISSVYQSLAGIGSVVALPVERPQPAVSVRKSIQPEFLICLEDGKKLKMLKRHLASTYGMTPDQYRAKWSLGPDYPMVAPNYSAQRSNLAKALGLGTTSRRGVEAEPATPPAAAARRGNKTGGTGKTGNGRRGRGANAAPADANAGADAAQA